MDPTLLLQLFPLFIMQPSIPPLDYSPSTPVKISSRQNYYSKGRQPDIVKDVTSYNPDPELRVEISFPGTKNITTSVSNQVKSGEMCFTQDGRFGTCQRFPQCQAFMHYSGYAQKITRCVKRGQKSTLICCPVEKGEQGEINSTPPTTTTPLPDEEKNLGEIDIATPSIYESTTTETTTSIPITLGSSNSLDFLSDAAQKACGVYDPSDQSPWPWVVSIGHKNRTMVHTSCLGSLITPEYILTSATCLEGSPTVVTVGQPFVGDISFQQLKQHAVIHTIAESIQNDKFVYPAVYKNMGLIRLLEKITVSSQVMPICFPFLAGVLDITDFAGQYASTLSYPRISVTQPGETSQEFKIRQSRIFKNDLCGKVMKRNPSSSLKERFPKGIRSEIMCSIAKTKEGPPLCPVSGTPLVILDDASRSYVLIGIAVGDSTCADLQGKITMFSRINSFSTWVRDHVAELPTPPPCYV